jgi:hypothetical protein
MPPGFFWSKKNAASKAISASGFSPGLSHGKWNTGSIAEAKAAEGSYFVS